MKVLKIFIATIFVGIGLASCNQSANTEDSNFDDQQETITPDNTSTDEMREDDEDNSIGIDIKADDEGNVEGEFEGDIDLDKK